MRAMGLLPLSALAAHGLQRPKDEATGASILAMIRESTLLDRAHFLPIAEPMETIRAMREVAANPGRYFPFSYR